MARIHSVPAEFANAAKQLRDAQFRSELHVREIAAPERIAPHAIAFSAGVHLDGSHPAEGSGDSRYGAGRLVLLHDPDSSDEWGAPFRVICYAQAPLEVEIGVDPFIADVAWSWLIEALDARGAQYINESGTATKTLSTGFGSLESQGDGAQLELRASWTPVGGDFTAHASAWSEVLCLLAGLPHHEGVTPLAAHRSLKQHRNSKVQPRG